MHNTKDTAIKEAKRLEIPTIAIVDSNTDPNKVTFPIPANDDSMRTINIIISALADAVLEAKGNDLNNNQVMDESPASPKESKPISAELIQEEE